jgi:uncharacterized protein YecA (UPF0149 family)
MDMAGIQLQLRQIHRHRTGTVSQGTKAVEIFQRMLRRKACCQQLPQQFSGGELPEELIAVLQAQMQKKAMEQGAITVNGGFDNAEQNFSVKSEQPQAQEPRIVLQPAVRMTPKVGANEPCPCGSGKKYKKCCGK